MAEIQQIQRTPGISDLASKLGQIGPKWDKSVTFSDQISEHFGAGRQNALKLILKSPRFVPFGGQSDPIWKHNLTPLLLTDS